MYKYMYKSEAGYEFNIIQSPFVYPSYDYFLSYFHSDSREQYAQ